jgi:hypothetical protein
LNTAKAASAFRWAFSVTLLLATVIANRLGIYTSYGSAKLVQQTTAPKQAD